MILSRQYSLIAITACTQLLSACSGGDESGSTALPSDKNPSALILVGQPAATVTLGSEYYFNMNATGGNQSGLAFSIINKPSWAKFNTVTGELKGTPTAVGSFKQIVISVTDGVSSTSSKQFSIDVLASGMTTAVASAQLTWAPPKENSDGSPLDSISGYVVHYGTSSTALDKKIEIGSAVVTSYSVGGLQEGKVYYFAISAVNAQNVEGELSTPISLQM